MRTGRLVLAFVAVLLLAAVGFAAGGWYDFVGPGPLASPKSVVVPRGSGIKQIARQLEEAGVVRHGLTFEAGLRLDDGGATLRAGEYAFQPRISVRDVIGAMRRGDVVVRRFTLPEGLTTAEALHRLAEAEGLVGDVPEVPEGRLLPDTYHYSWGDSRAELVERMRKAMDAALERIWRRRKPDGPITTPEQALTLASIVEKETGVAAERPRVAAVFLNRLAQGMKLQSDPTVIYALTNGQRTQDRPLTREDLRVESPYNTYFVEGLPPGPIASPGLASLEAVVSPVETQDLYFVADGSGGHAFARTLAEHNRNVAKWRQVQREREAEAKAGASARRTDAPAEIPAPASADAPAAKAP